MSADEVGREQRNAAEVVWTIAGFDPSNGAGVTADLMTFAAHRLFGCSAITASTVQSTLGVATVEATRPGLLGEMLDCLLADLPPAGVKIGMLGTPEIAEVVAAFVERLRAGGKVPPVVVDPVLRSSSGRELYPAAALGTVHEKLLPHVDWLTPNWGELALLSELPVRTEDEAERAAKAVRARHPHLNIVVTGGDRAVPTELVLLSTGEQISVSGEHVETRATHGTGCAFSSALLCQLVKGARPEEAVRRAKAYVGGALQHAPGVGHGNGPMGLLWPLFERGESLG